MEEVVIFHNIITEMWKFLKPRLSNPPHTEKEHQDNIKAVEDILIPYNETPYREFAIKVFETALDELERRDKHD